MSKNQKYFKAAEYIKSADAIIFTSGAGMGVDSGLPDFRGNEGFWKAYPPIAKLGVSFIEMANPKWFYEEPRLAWAFYGHRFNLYRQTVPHKGFHQLLEMGESAPEGYFVFTSNVDGQYQKAGFNPNAIAEIHGSILHFQCLDACTDEIWEADVDMIDVDETVFAASEPFPACPNCGGMARPNILMFGDWGWLHQRSTAQEKILNDFFDELYKYHKIVIIETGAGSGLPTVRRFSESISRKYEAPLIRINPRETNLGRSHESSLAFAEGAASGIDKIYTEYKKL